MKAPTTSRRIPFWGGLLIALGTLLLLLLASPLVAVVSLVVLVTAIVGLARGSSTWLRLNTQGIRIGVLVAASVTLVISSSIGAAVIGGASRSEAVAAFASATSSPATVKTIREEVETQTIPFDKQTIEDASIPRGESRVTTVGVDGERQFTYVVTIVDGEEISRVLKSKVVTLAPVTEVTAVGTYDPPTEEPSTSQSSTQNQSSCDPNYADGCVPIASDVDCAGGSGNGPAYFSGTARVVGRDIYDLDRDGDGIACE